MNRASMDRFIDTIEWIAAGFVGIVALDVFVSVLLRNTLNYSIPDSFDIGRMLLGRVVGRKKPSAQHHNVDQDQRRH